MVQGRGELLEGRLGAAQSEIRLVDAGAEVAHNVPHLDALVPKLRPRVRVRTVQTSDVAVLLGREERGRRRRCVVWS